MRSNVRIVGPSVLRGRHRPPVAAGRRGRPKNAAAPAGKDGGRHKKPLRGRQDRYRTGTGRYRTALRMKSRTNRTATVQMTGCTWFAFFLQVITMQYMMKPPAMP